MNNNKIQYAVTLTTGDEYNIPVCRRHNETLNELLLKYREYFYEFLFTLEILDNALMETKIHYHGYVVVRYIHIQQFQRFIQEWNKSKFVKIKLITDKQKWIEYILKHQTILKIGYPDIGKILFNAKNLNNYRNVLKQWKK